MVKPVKLILMDQRGEVKEELDGVGIVFHIIRSRTKCGRGDEVEVEVSSGIYGEMDPNNLIMAKKELNHTIESALIRLAMKTIQDNLEDDKEGEEWVK